jgi:hypothetical protein
VEQVRGDAELIHGVVVGQLWTGRPRILVWKIASTPNFQ